MKTIAQAVVALGCVIAGLYGLAHGIEYSGWVLFGGLAGVFCYF